MSVRIHTTKVYDVQYGNTISSEVTSDIINLIRKSITGYISDDEEELEISRKELFDFRNSNMSVKLQRAIDQILEESDPNNDFIHLSIF